MSAFVVRLLDADNALLSWAKVAAVPSPQPGRASCPLTASPGLTKFVIERDGVVSKMAVHWTDLDVARVRELPDTPVQLGQVFDFVWFEPVWLVQGMQDVVLPPVTERRSIVVTVPPAQMGAKDPRT